MARVGFYRSYAEGALDLAAVQTLFADIKAALIAAEFNVVLNTDNEIDVLRMAAPLGTKDDDAALGVCLNDQDPYGDISAYAVFGADYLDPTWLHRWQFGRQYELA